MRLRCTRVATRASGAGWSLTPAETVPDYTLIDAAAGTYAAGFTRSGTVQVADDAGVLRTFSTDVPAREYLPGYGWGYWTHAAYTAGQNGKQSHDLTGWAFSSCTVTADATSPATSGGSTLIRERAVSGPWECPAQWLGSVAAGAYMSVSVVVGPLTNRVLGIDTNNAGIRFDYATGIASVAYGTAQTRVTALAGGWYRLDARLLFTGAANNPIFYVKSQGAVSVGDVTKGLHLYCFNLNNSGLLGMPIVVTSTTAVAIGEARWRNTLSSAGVSAVGALGLNAYNLSPAALAASRHMMRIDAGTDDQRSLLYQASTATDVRFLTTSGAVNHIDSGSPATAAFGAASNISAAASARGAFNGAEMTVTDSGLALPVGMTHWSVGGSIGAGLGAPMLVRRAWMHGSNLTMDQLKAESLK